MFKVTKLSKQTYHVLFLLLSNKRPKKEHLEKNTGKTGKRRILITAARALLKEPDLFHNRGKCLACSFFSCHLCKLPCCFCMLPAGWLPFPATKLSRGTPDPHLVCLHRPATAHAPRGCQWPASVSRSCAFPVAALLYHRLWVQCPGGVVRACRCHSHFRGE